MATASAAPGLPYRPPVAARQQPPHIHIANRVDREREHTSLASSTAAFVFASYVRHLLALYYSSISIYGLDNVPPRGTPTILVSNHRNLFVDGLLMSVVAPQRQVAFLVAEVSLRFPLMARLAKLLGYIPVKRSQDSAVTGEGAIVELRPLAGPRARVEVVGRGTSFRSQALLGHRLLISGAGAYDELKVLSVQSDELLTADVVSVLPDEAEADAEQIAVVRDTEGERAALSARHEAEAMQRQQQQRRQLQQQTHGGPAGGPPLQRQPSDERGGRPGDTTTRRRAIELPAARFKLGKPIDQRHVFQNAIAKLGHGWTIGMCPEGRSTDRHGLQPLKPGAAALALATAAEHDVPVAFVPVGLLYRAYAFRSHALAVAGEPFAPPPRLLGAYREGGERRAAATRTLTRYLRRRLSELAFADADDAEEARTLVSAVEVVHSHLGHALAPEAAQHSAIAPLPIGRPVWTPHVRHSRHWRSRSLSTSSGSVGAALGASASSPGGIAEEPPARRSAASTASATVHPSSAPLWPVGLVPEYERLHVALARARRAARSAAAEDEGAARLRAAIGRMGTLRARIEASGLDRPAHVALLRGWSARGLRAWQACAAAYTALLLLLALALAPGMAPSAVAAAVATRVARAHAERDRALPHKDSGADVLASFHVLIFAYASTAANVLLATCAAAGAAVLHALGWLLPSAPPGLVVLLCALVGCLCMLYVRLAMLAADMLSVAAEHWWRTQCWLALSREERAQLLAEVDIVRAMLTPVLAAYIPRRREPLAAMGAASLGSAAASQQQQQPEGGGARLSAGGARRSSASVGSGAGAAPLPPLIGPDGAPLPPVLPPADAELELGGRSFESRTSAELLEVSSSLWGSEPPTPQERDGPAPLSSVHSPPHQMARADAAGHESPRSDGAGGDGAHGGAHGAGGRGARGSDGSAKRAPASSAQPSGSASGRALAAAGAADLVVDERGEPTGGGAG